MQCNRAMSACRMASALTSPDNVVDGVAPNELTSGTDRDWLAGTPWHKHVRARLEAIVEAVA